MFEHLFGSKTRFRLLQIFFNSPNKNFFVRELVRMSGVQLNSVRRELSNLEKIGLIGQTAVGDKKADAKSKFYQVRTDCLFYFEIKDLLNKIQIVEEQEIIEEIRKKAGDIKLFLLTGIFTQDQGVSSDMLIVGTVKPMVLDKLITKFEKVMARDIRFTIMKESEFHERKELGDKFLYSLFEAKHILIYDAFRVE
jgi:predicted transcriptional regulator